MTETNVSASHFRVHLKEIHDPRDARKASRASALVIA